MLEDRQISFELTDPARQLILAAGSDAAYGARPLKRRVCSAWYRTLLAMKILDGEVLHGAHVRIDADRNFKPVALRADGPRSHGLTTCGEAEKKV